MQVRVVNNITKEYPDMIKVLVYKTPKYYEVSDRNIKRNSSSVGDDYIPSVSSLNRTKILVRDIVLCNDFDLFCTFTFDPSKVNRYNYGQCYGKISRWLHHQKDKAPDLKYLVVPEQHKDGAWHFHALIANYNGSLRDSKHRSGSGRRVYNITSYRSGFSTAVEIDNREAVASYVTKYITKDFIKTFNKRRFFCSRNLQRPVKTVNSPILSLTLPLFRQKVSDLPDKELFILPKDY